MSKVSIEEMKKVIREDFERDENNDLIGFMAAENSIECSDYSEEYFESGRGSVPFSRLLK